MIQFKCPACAGRIETAERLAHQWLDCPHCDHSVPVPDDVGGPSDSGLICWLGAGLTAVSATTAPDDRW